MSRPEHWDITARHHLWTIWPGGYKDSGGVILMHWLTASSRILWLQGQPGSYQRLDLFIKVLRVLCPNVTAASQVNFKSTMRL